jgi:hypothetical protein
VGWRLRAGGRLVVVPGSDVVTDDDGYCSRNGSGRHVLAFGAGESEGVVGGLLVLESEGVVGGCLSSTSDPPTIPSGRS